MSCDVWESVVSYWAMYCMVYIRTALGVLKVKVAFSEVSPYASRHGKSDSGGEQSQLKGRLHSYKVIISSCSMELCTSLSSIHQDIKGFITHPLVNPRYSLPLVNAVKWSGFEAPACIPLVSSSQTTLCLTSTLCSWSYFWQAVLGTK